MRWFDAYMIYSEERRIIDYLGSHQHLAVEIDLRVDEQGALCLRSGAQRFYEGPVAFACPMGMSGIAEVRERLIRPSRDPRFRTPDPNSAKAEWRT